MRCGMDSRLTFDFIILSAQQGDIVWAIEIASAKIACEGRCNAQRQQQRRSFKAQRGRWHCLQHSAKKCLRLNPT